MPDLTPEAAIGLLEKTKTKYICTLCSPCNSHAANGEKYSLEMHCHIRHPDCSHICCAYCLQSVSVTTIQQHISRHFELSDQRPYICPLCPESYETAKALGQHAITIHRSKPSLVFYKCGYCNKPTETAEKLAEHLSDSYSLLYHCHYPHCLVKSTDYDLMLSHAERSHGVSAPCITVTRQFTCAFVRELKCALAEKPEVALPEHFSLFCTCSFGTIHLENFADHIAHCSSMHRNGGSEPLSLSVTCNLHHCKQCGWMSSVKNILQEHVRVRHPSHSEVDSIISEEFTVPRSEEHSSSIPTIDSALPVTSDLTSLSGSQSADVLSAVTSHLNEWSYLLNPANLSSLFCPPAFPMTSLANGLSQMNDPSSVALASLSQLPTSSSSFVKHTDDDFGAIPTPSDASDLALPSETTYSNELPSNPKVNEYVQLYFNENAFLAAYTARSNKTNWTVRTKEIAQILPKLRHFATYKIPILGRANQRRVAGCPECMKPFNHGFTDLKKHLLVTHLNVRKELTKFVLDFTHSARSHIQVAKPETSVKSLSAIKQHLFSLRASRTPTKTSRKRNIKSLFPSQKFSLHSSLPHKLNKLSNGSNCPESPIGSAYSGGAPVHRVIPITGVSDQVEDMKTFEEVASEAPVGRGGIIPLDDNGNPDPDAVLAATQQRPNETLKQLEVYLPKLGLQHIKLAYSYPVFIHLLGIYKVPETEQIQLINRMNHYARLHVIMDVLVPNCTQRHFSCPTCQYKSIHSLADIRKHIMGSHCGISTKRFRLCLRASRHDTTTYRLHSDEKMIRFVEEHQRRKARTPDFKNDDSKDFVFAEDEDMNHSDVSENMINVSRPSVNSQEDLETWAIEEQEDEFYDRSPGNFCGSNSGLESDHEFPNGISVPHQTRKIDYTNGPPTPDRHSFGINRNAAETIGDDGMSNLRIDLPFSSNVLRILLERENMIDYLDTVVKKMEVYSSYHLTVTSHGNRIQSYTCVCGRVFPVVRDSKESDVRPASLADCRRHILGVHARIPQELLTLCCQASRISKESAYKLYSDSSLLALAEQHRFRSTRVQSYKNTGTVAIAKASIKKDDVGVPTSPSTSSNNPPDYAPTQVSMRKASTYIHRSLPPMLRAPTVKFESDRTHDDTFDPHQPYSSNKVNSPPIPDPIAATTQKRHGLHFILPTERHCGLDLKAPRRLLTNDEATEWGENLSLPEEWILERIVNLPYNRESFDEQLYKLIPNDRSFTENLHERMEMYSRHSVYIVRLSRSNNQRIYVCCSCLTTSQHGFGDVRKHILGVHAHIPERFKTIAMNSSRLSREDYSLQADTHTTSKNVNYTTLKSLRSPSTTSSTYQGGDSDRVLRRRQRSDDFSPVLRSHNASPSKKRFHSDLDSFSDSVSNKAIPSNNCSNFSPSATIASSSNNLSRDDLNRPPIILTLPRPKAFHSNHSIPSPSSSSDFEKISGEDSVLSDVVVNTESRGRRSMILKSKRPCPTTN